MTDRPQIPAEVSVRRSDPIYNAHSYHTKVPPRSIIPYILHYTQPGDLVLIAGRLAELRDTSIDDDALGLDAALAALVSALGLDAPPSRIECADVSTIQGSFTVSSLVVAIDGQPPVVAEVPDVDDLIETAGRSGYLQWVFRPVRGGLWSEGGIYQEIGGRITRYPGRKNEKVPASPHRDITLMGRWMDAMGVDMAVMFPTPMLNLSACPRIQVEVALSKAYNRWLCDEILAEDPRIKSMLFLPYNDPEACYQTVLEFGERQGVIGFMATARTPACLNACNSAQVTKVLPAPVSVPVMNQLMGPAGAAG